MNTQDTTKAPETLSDEKEIATAFVRVGAAWARYGLGIARASVETSAHTLEATAGVLGVLADRFGKLAHPADAAESDNVVETSAEPRH